MRPAIIRYCSTARRWRLRRDRLQVTNGNLYAKTKAGKYSVRWPAGASWVAGAAPAEGTAAAAVSLAVVLPQIPDNSPAGTIVAKAAVTMSPAGATFTGPLVSSDPLFTAQGANIVLSRAVTPADDGTARRDAITALQ